MKLIFWHSRLATSFNLASALIVLIGAASCQSIRAEVQSAQVLPHPRAAAESDRAVSASSLVTPATGAWQSQPITLPIQAREIGISREGTRVIALTDHLLNRSSNEVVEHLEVWNTQTQERILSLPSTKDMQFEAMTISNDGSKVAAIIQNRDHNLSLWIWDIDSDQPPIHESLDTPRPIFGPFLSRSASKFAVVSSVIAFSSDGTHIVTKVKRLSDQDAGNEAQVLQLHSATTGQVLHTLTPTANTQIEQFAFSPNSEQLIGAGRLNLNNATGQAASPVVNLWQTRNGQLVSSFSPDHAIANDGANDLVSNELGYIAAVAFTPTGQLKTLSNVNLTSDQLVTWNLSTPIVPDHVQTLLEVDRQDFIHVLSPDGIYHFMQGDVAGARLLNTETLAIVRLDERVSEAVFSADGNHLAIASSETVQIFSKSNR